MKCLSNNISKLLIGLSVLVVVVSLCLAGHQIWLQGRDSLADAPYYTSKLESSLDVQTDGSVHAVEQRTFHISQDSPDIQWTISNIGEKKLLSIDSMRVSVLDDQGQVTETYRLSKAAFDISWSIEGDSVSFAAFDFEYPTRTMHLYTGGFADTQGGSNPKSLLVTTEYTIDQAAVPYRDVSSLSWEVVSGTNNIATRDVSVTVSLPVLTSNADGSDVRTWSQGPVDGQLQMGDDYLITYHVDYVDVWQYATLSVIFPTAWLPNVPADVASLHNNELYKEKATTAALNWADAWHLRAMHSYVFDMICIGICVALCLFALVLYVLLGRSRKPDYVDQYYDQVPQEGLHPAVASRIWRWNRKNVADLRAAIVYLVAKGAIRVEKAKDASASQKDTSAVAGYRLIRVDAVADTLTDPIDQKTLWLLFSVVAKRAKDVRVQELRAFKRDHADQQKEALDAWQATLSESFDEWRYFECAGKRWQTRLFLLALLALCAGIALYLMFGHPVTLGSFAATALVVALVANYIPRRTVEGNNIAARSKALRNWLRDPHQPKDAAQLCKLMPFACAFEVGACALDKAIQLSSACEDEDLGIMDDEDAHWRCCLVTDMLREM